jgi:hypothetical protein
MSVQAALVRCGLTEEHFSAIAESVAEGYAALRKLVDSTPMLRQFIPGIRSVGHLRNVAVQHALQNKAAVNRLFYTMDALNAARNQAFLKLQVGQVILTSHYCGATGKRGVRRSLARAELALHTPDLFESEKPKPDLDVLNGSAYAQILHGGLSDPVRAAIVIPNRDQETYELEPMILPIVKPSVASVEEVENRLAQTLKRKGAGKQRHAG